MKPFERLDEAMNRRRLELRMNWRQVADAAGISYTALRAIRRGDYRPTELTARNLDEALQWMPGSVSSALDGGNPVPIDAARAAEADTAPSPPEQLSSRELEALAEIVASYADGLGFSQADVDAAHRRAQQIIEERRRQREGRGDEPETPSRGDRAS